MVTLRAPVGSTHVQIDDFGVEVERSCKGSLHLHPGSVRQVTSSEWEHIQKKHPGVASRLQVLKDEVPAPKPVPAPAVTMEKVEAAPLPVAEPDVQEAEVQEAKPILSARRRLRRERAMRKV
jgi:hypothetical protein